MDLLSAWSPVTAEVLPRAHTAPLAPARRAATPPGPHGAGPRPQDERPRWGMRVATTLSVLVLAAGGHRARGGDQPGQRDRPGRPLQGHEEPAPRRATA